MPGLWGLQNHSGTVHVVTTNLCEFTRLFSSDESFSSSQVGCLGAQHETQGPCSMAQFRGWVRNLRMDARFKAQLTEFSNVSVWKVRSVAGLLLAHGRFQPAGCRLSQFRSSSWRLPACRMPAGLPQNSGADLPVLTSVPRHAGDMHVLLKSMRPSARKGREDERWGQHK